MGCIFGEIGQTVFRELSRRAHVEAEEGDLFPDPDPLLHHVRDVLLLVQPGNKGLFEQLWS